MHLARWTFAPAAARPSTGPARVRPALAWVVCGAVVFAPAGCTAPRRPLVVADPDPAVKIPAYKKAVRQKDRDAVRQLVTDLESDDPAVRLYASNALRRLTGETFGYRYYDGDERRQAAVGRWRRWLEAGEAGAVAEAGGAREAARGEKGPGGP